MRVVIATDRYPALSSAQAGATMGAAWAERGAEVAVVPMGLPGDGLGEALASLWRAEQSLVQVDDRTVTIARGVDGEGRTQLAVTVHAAAETQPGPFWHGDSSIVARAVLAALDSSPRPAVIVLDVAAPTWQDGGRGMLDAWGARVAGEHLDLTPVRDLLGDARLVLTAASEDVTASLTGLRGITSRAAHASGGLDPAEMLRLDQVLVDLAAATSRPDLATASGSGAVGGLGFAVQALDGRVLGGPALCRELSGLDDTLAHADLVVTGGGALDFGTMGGDVLTEVRLAAADHLVPCVVIAGENFISPRELRSIGVEAAYPVRRPGPDELAQQARPITAHELREVADQVSASWCW